MMISITKKIVAIAFAIASQVSYANLADTAVVYLRGEPGSWVSGGIGAPEATWVHGVHGIFDASTNFSQGISIRYQGDNSWNFDFAAPSYDPETNTNVGQPLEVQFYANATRWPFNSPTRPGLNVSGAGRGNNQLSGWFNVLEVEYGTGGSITSFAVDFRQYDENLTQTGPSLYGSLRFNSAIPVTLTPVPEPAPTAMLLAGLGVLACAVRRSRQRHGGA
jgi:PEP-CTERM motif